jgi:pSer/pThr/pTyr-binding forkhead associated (FHA) protein
MGETRVIIGHAHNNAQAPHLDLPAGFLPLRLCVQAEQVHIEVTCPSAIVGRHTDADLRFAYADVSRRHCRLAFENGQWRVHDLKSTNGIYVNNTQIVEATLYTGDVLRLGCVKLLVESGTVVRLLTAEEEKHERLRQIVEALPAADTRRAS